MIFDPATLAMLRKTQEDHMQDLCVIYRVTKREKNSRGEPVKTFDEGTESICGIDMDPQKQSYSDSYSMAQIDAVLRLPHLVEVKPDDEIEITERYGEAVTPMRYKVDRFVDAGPSGIRAYLKRITIV